MITENTAADEVKIHCWVFVSLRHLVGVDMITRTKRRPVLLLPTYFIVNLVLRGD